MPQNAEGRTIRHPPETTFPLYVAGRRRETDSQLPVYDKFCGRQIASTAVADGGLMEEAIAAAYGAVSAMKKMRPFARAEVLHHCVKRFKDRSEELAQLLCSEAGKPIRDARGEVTRLIDTFRIAAEEATRICGEMLCLEISPRASGYRGMYQRVPIGPCAFVTPFNFPLNLVAHKVAPAIAAGCPFVLKPASRTPLGALVIGEVLAETNLPHGAFSILPCNRDTADVLTTDERFRLLSFTGSAAAGWAMKARAGKKKVVLELGGNAACIVDQDADVTSVVSRLIFGAFYQSGQSCISVQRILIHESIYEPVRAGLTAAARQLVSGDPHHEETFVGPLIDPSEVTRLKRWIQAAVAAGATILCGGNGSGCMLEPTLLENVPADQPLWCEEAFGPVAVISRFSDFSEALRQVNNSRYGLQAGVFTRDIFRMHQAWDELEVGGVVIGDVPSWRVDNMPYGGVKDSGTGREGVRCSIEEMTEVRTLIIRGE